MNLIKNSLVYLLLLVFDVKTVVNDAEKLENCVTEISTSFSEASESSGNLLKLIDQSTVILKAFCSENLINAAEEEEGEDSDAGFKNDVNDADEDEYNDYYFYRNSNDKNIKTLMTFTPITIYKGTNILRQLELFNNQQYFLIKG